MKPTHEALLHALRAEPDTHAELTISREMTARKDALAVPALYGKEQQ